MLGAFVVISWIIGIEGDNEGRRNSGKLGGGEAGVWQWRAGGRMGGRGNNIQERVCGLDASFQVWTVLKGGALQMGAEADIA